MRLRQAHAILEAATALEASGLGFELQPLHYGYPCTPRHIVKDSMSGFTEVADPDDTEGSNARAYNVDISPGPDDDTIEARLTLGLGPDPESLLYTKHSVAIDVAEAEKFRGLVGARLAEDVVEAVHAHEKPYRAAYQERTCGR